MGIIQFETPPNLGMVIEYSRIPEDDTIPAIRAIYDPGVFYSGGPIHYEILSGIFPNELILNRETGVFTGMVNELDDYVPQFSRQGVYTPSNYATVGSASQFSGANGIPYVAYFIVKAYDSLTPSISSVQQYYLIIENNWSSDRDNFITEIPDQSFELNGVKVTNEEYLEGMKRLGYFQD